MHYYAIYLATNIPSAMITGKRWDSELSGLFLEISDL